MISDSLFVLQSAAPISSRCASAFTRSCRPPPRCRPPRCRSSWNCSRCFSPSGRATRSWRRLRSRFVFSWKFSALPFGVFSPLASSCAFSVFLWSFVRLLFLLFLLSNSRLNFIAFFSQRLARSEAAEGRRCLGVRSRRGAGHSPQPPHIRQVEMSATRTVFFFFFPCCSLLLEFSRTHVRTHTPQCFVFARSFGSIVCISCPLELFSFVA